MIANTIASLSINLIFNCLIVVVIGECYENLFANQSANVTFKMQFIA